MATVSFTRLWISPADDLASGVGFRLHQIAAQPSTMGEFRRYANGRTRLVTRTGGPKQQHAVTLKHLDIDSVRLLESWAGRVLLVRDPLGGKFWGAYLTPEITWRPVQTADVSLSFTEVTFSEAV